jgi:hypothetical protein
MPGKPKEVLVRSKAVRALWSSVETLTFRRYESLHYARSKDPPSKHTRSQEKSIVRVIPFCGDRKPWREGRRVGATAGKPEIDDRIANERYNESHPRLPEFYF